MATSIIKGTFVKGSFNGTPNVDGQIITNLKIADCVPIAVEHPSRSGWNYIPAVPNVFGEYWGVTAVGANASSGTFSGTIIALKK